MKGKTFPLAWIKFVSQSFGNFRVLTKLFCRIVQNCLAIGNFYLCCCLQHNYEFIF